MSAKSETGNSKDALTTEKNYTFFLKTNKLNNIKPNQTNKQKPSKPATF